MTEAPNRLSVEECENYIDTPDNKYLINVDFVLRQLADTMRALEAYRDAWVDNESESDMMEKLGKAEELAVKLCGEYRNKDTEDK